MSTPKEIVTDPKRAEAIDHLHGSFVRDYDLSRQADRQALVEGMTELGKHLVTTGMKANLAFSFGSDGIVAVNITSTPSVVPAAGRWLTVPTTPFHVPRRPRRLSVAGVVYALNGSA
jgi:hypothetical protein